MKKAITLIIILLCSMYMIAQDENSNIVEKGDKMPEFTLSSTKYGDIDSKDLKGKVVLINIFATWCPPCQQELAEVKKTLWPKYKDNANFVMLTVGREHTDEELAKYNEKKKFTFPLYPDPKRGFTSKFATISIPRSYLIDKEGKIVYMSIGYNENDFSKLVNLIGEKLND